MRVQLKNRSCSKTYRTFQYYMELKKYRVSFNHRLSSQMKKHLTNDENEMDCKLSMLFVNKMFYCCWQFDNIKVFSSFKYWEIMTSKTDILIFCFNIVIEWLWSSIGLLHCLDQLEKLQISWGKQYIYP